MLLLAIGAGSALAQDDDITIYRCTDAKGQLTLQDAPCGKDKSQQTRRMLQPQGPPTGAAPTARVPLSQTTIPEAPPAAIVLRTPQPMYECVRADGDRYASDDDAGNPRWVSSDWTLDDAVPVYTSGIVSRATATPVMGAGNSVRSASDGNGAPQLHFRNVPPAEPPSPPPPRPGHGHGHGHGHGFGYGYSYGGGMWVRDECHALPQVETCSRLRDRREEIRRRFFNAQETERATLDKEERGINARLSADCGGA